MLSFEYIVQFDENEIASLLENINPEEIIRAIINEYPDYYNLRGVVLDNLSQTERARVKAVLKKEIM